MFVNKYAKHLSRSPLFIKALIPLAALLSMAQARVVPQMPFHGDRPEVNLHKDGGLGSEGIKELGESVLKPEYDPNAVEDQNDYEELSNGDNFDAEEITGEGGISEDFADDAQIKEDSSELEQNEHQSLNSPSTSGSHLRNGERGPNVLIEKMTDGTSVAYVTKAKAELLMKNKGKKLTADIVILPSEIYENVKSRINTQRFAICSSEEEMQSLMKNMTLLNLAGCSSVEELMELIQYTQDMDLGIFSSEEKIQNLLPTILTLRQIMSQNGVPIPPKNGTKISNEVLLNKWFSNDATLKLLEQKFREAIYEKKPSLLSRAKSLLTPHGIIEASKYTFSKARDLTAYLAKSAIALPFCIPGLLLNYKMHKDISSPAVWALLGALSGERPEQIAISVLAFGPTLLGAQYLAELPASVLNKVWPLSYLSPLVSYGTYLMGFPAVSSACQYLLELSLWLLSYCPPFAYIGNVTKNFIDRFYKTDPIELVTSSERERRSKAILDSLAEAADNAESLILPHSFEQNLGSAMLDGMKMIGNAKKLTRCVKQNVEQNPGLINLLEEPQKADVATAGTGENSASDTSAESKNTNDAEKADTINEELDKQQELKSSAESLYISMVNDVLDVFQKKIAESDRGKPNFAKQSLQSQKALLEKYLRRKVEVSRAILSESSLGERKANIELFKKSIATLYPALQSDALAVSLYEAHLKIQSGFGYSPEDTEFEEKVASASNDLEKEFSNKLAEFYDAIGTKIDRAEVDLRANYLLSLELPMDNVIEFRNAIATDYLAPFQKQIKLILQHEIFAQMDDSMISLLSDYYFCNFTQLEKADPDVLGRILRRLLQGAGVSYEGNGSVKLGDRIITIEDFVNNHLRPNSAALLSEFREEERPIFNSILYLFDKENKDLDEYKQFQDVFLLLCDAHAAKPHKGLLAKAWSYVSSFINYTKTSEVAIVALATLASASQIHNLSVLLLAPGLYTAYRLQGRSRSEAFFSLLPQFFVPNMLGRILGLNMLDYMKLKSSQSILANLISVVINHFATTALIKLCYTITEYSNEISNEQFTDLIKKHIAPLDEKEEEGDEQILEEGNTVTA